MDSGLEERILPSIRRPQMLLIHRNGGVDNPETCGQIACAVGRLPIRFTVGTGGTISVWAQATRSVFCRAESASVADSAEWVLAQRRGEPLEKDTSARERQSALRFFNSSEEQA